MSVNKIDEMKVQRIFVGGLYTGITEEDLTKRLSKFGTITNVYIHERQNDAGVITKTFAVLDMGTTERNLCKCFTAYSNSMWKGHTMRLQKYKEDPFERERKRKEPRKRFEPEGFGTDNQHTIRSSHTQVDYQIRNTPRTKNENVDTVSSKKTTRINKTYPSNTCKVSPTQKINNSFTKVQHGKRKQSSDSDESAACQGVPKFGGIYLQNSSNLSTENNSKDVEFSIVKNQFPNVKSNDVASDQESVATDEIIAVSKLKKKHFVASIDDSLSKKPISDFKKTTLSKNKNNLEAQARNTNASSPCPPRKLTEISKRSTHESSKGVLGRLEGFSSVWQDDGDEDGNEWERKLAIAKPLEFKSFKEDKDDIMDMPESSFSSQQTECFRDDKNERCSPELQRFELAKDDSRFNRKIKKEHLPVQKFSPSTAGSRFRNYEHGNNEKHAHDNWKRLESMKKLQSALADKRKTIEVALSFKGATIPTSNKKIKFDSDGEDNFEPQFEKDTYIKKTVEGVGNGLDAKQKRGRGRQKEKQLLLFDDDDNNDGGENEVSDDDDAGNMFYVRPQFEGVAGEKLFKLQSRFGDDKRFVVDQRFLEESSEDESDAAKMTKIHSDVEDVKDEKSRNLEILQNIIGNDVIFKHKNESSTKGNSTMLRYDPSKADHGQFEIKMSTQEQSSPKKKKVKKTLPSEPEPLPEVSKETFYEVNDNLKNIFEKKSTEEESFSLLKTLGRDQSQPEVVDEKNVGVYDEQKISAHERHAKLLGLSTFKYDSSDDDQEAKEIPKHSPSAPVSTVDKTQLTFFFQKDDSRLAESVSFFRRTETLDVLQEKWKSVRHALYEDLLTKSKRSIRKKAPKKVKKGGMPKRRFKARK